MRNLSFLLLLCSSILYGQFTVTIMGEVRLHGNGLENCHIVNRNTGDATITGRQGSFFINASEGDLLAFTHISTQNKNVLLSKQHIKSAILSIDLVEATTELEEVSLSVNTQVTAASVRLPNAGKPIPTANERRLATAGDFKPIHLLSLLGGSLELDPIINAISGRTARIKKHIEVDKKIAVNEIVIWYYEEWLRERLDISEDETIQLMDYLTDDTGITKLLEENNEQKVQIYLLDQYRGFLDIKKDLNPMPKLWDGGF